LGEALIKFFAESGKAGLIKSGQKPSKYFTSESSNGHQPMNKLITDVNRGLGVSTCLSTRLGCLPASDPQNRDLLWRKLWLSEQSFFKSRFLGCLLTHLAGSASFKLYFQASKAFAKAAKPIVDPKG
jgi:hypothetical protein